MNNDFLDSCETFNIVVHTTAAESPWLNGLVERHNLILADMLNKVIADMGSLFSSPHFLKREKSGLLNNLKKLVQSIININSSDTPPTCMITA